MVDGGCVVMKKILPLFAALWALLSALLAQASPHSAPSPAPQSTATPEPTDASQLDWARQRLKEATEAARVFQVGAFSEELKAAGIPVERAVEYQASWDAVVRNYQGAVDALGAAATNREALEKTRVQPEPTPPKNDQEVAAFHSEIDNLGPDLAALETQIGLVQSALDSQHELLAQSERTLRQLTSNLEAAAPGDRPKAALLLKLEEARHEEISSALFATTWRSRADALERERLELRRTRLQSVLAASGLDSVLREVRTTAELAAVAANVDKIRARVEKARTVSGNLVSRLEDLRAKGNTPEDVLDITSQTSQIAQKITRGYELWLAGLRGEEKVWRSAAAAAAAPGDPDAQIQVRDAAAEAMAVMSPWLDFFHRSIQDTTRVLETLKADATPKDAKTLRLLELQQARLEQLLSMEDATSRFLGVARRMQEEARGRLAKADFALRASLLAGTVRDGAKGIWDAELFTTDQVISGPDGTPRTRKRGVTLGKLLTVLLVVILCLAAAKFLAHRLTRRLRRQLSVDAPRSEFFERVLFLLIATVVILVGLQWLHIPLTTFAFLGGALAIAAGFGLQNLLNNFVSGLILAVERRINIGDIIEVDGQRGKVTSLGTRYSILRKLDGIEVLVPNSQLLEKQVANWTLSSPLHQFDFPVQIDIRPDAERVLAVLQTAVEAQPDIVKIPRPRVLLEAFSDKTLTFRVTYWLDVRKGSAPEVGGEIRLRALRVLHEANIPLTPQPHLRAVIVPRSPES